MTLFDNTSPRVSFLLCVCCSQMERERKDGLIENHAYSIMRAIDVHGEKLVQIRNPWVRWED